MVQESKIGKRTVRAMLVLLVLCLAMCMMPYAFSQSDAAENAVVPAYTVGNRSSAKYGTNETFGITGLQVALAPQESITFNTLIALKDINPDAPLIEANVTPSFRGAQDFRRLFFTFTDALNPEIFFTVQYRNWENESKTIVSAMANGQDYSSVEWYTGKIFHGKDEWHTTCQYAFSGVYTDGREHADRPIRIWYDDRAKQPYYDKQYTDNGDAAKDNRKVICDFIDPNFVSDIWTGFKSDYVRLSVSAEEYIGDTAYFAVTHVTGIDLTKESVYEQHKPVITVDAPFDLENVPFAKVGATFPVPAATAVDAQFGVCEVTSKVEFAETPNGEKTAVAVQNGRFATANEGYYTITYTARDPIGNEADTTVTVQTGDVADVTLTVTPPEDRTAAIGALVEVPAPDSNAPVTVKAVCGEQEIVIGDDCAFRPEKSGAWTVTYTAEDVCGQTQTESYTLTVTAGGTVFKDEPALAPVMISGGRYYLPELRAYSYAGDVATEVESTVSVKDLSGERVVDKGEVYIPRVAKHGDSVEIVYKAGEAELKREVQCIMPFVARDGRMRLQIENYFMGDGFELKKGDFSAEVAATDANGQWVFAKEQILSEMRVQFSMLTQKSEFDALCFTVFDATDPERSITCKIEREKEYDDEIGELVYSENAYFTVGGMRIPAGSLFDPSVPNSNVVVSFKNGKWVFDSTKTFSIAAERWDDGTPFEGFGGNSGYIGIAFEGATAGKASYMLSEVSNQLISANPADRMAPVIVMQGVYGGMCEVGKSATVQKALASDALDPMISFGVTVNAPDGSVVTSNDGIRLENVSPDRIYEFTPDMFGMYSVEYAASDSFGNEQKFVYIVLVLDNVAPEIAFTGEPVKTGKVGEAFIIPEITVTDNVSAAENITVSRYVRTASGRMTTIDAKSNSFIPSRKGVYTVYVIAHDEAGNVAVKTYDVTVA